MNSVAPDRQAHFRRYLLRRYLLRRHSLRRYLLRRYSLRRYLLRRYSLRRLVTRVLAVAALVPAGIATATTISDIYADALKADPVLAAARASTASRRETVVQSRSALLPQVTASARMLRTTTSYVDPVLDFETQELAIPPDEERTGRGWGAELNQPVLNMQSWFGYRGAQALAKQADWELSATDQALITRVADAYLNVLRGEAALESVVAAEQAIHRQLEQVQQRFDVGLVAITDVLEAKAEYDNAVVNRIQAEGNHDSYFEGLRTLTGRPYKEVDQLDESLPIINPEPGNEQEWVQAALAGNYRIQAARQALTAAERQLAAQLSAHLPTITASASYGTNIAGGGRQAIFGGNETNSVTYSLNLNLPLFSGLRTQSNVKQARYDVEQVRQQLIERELTVARDTRNLFRAVLTEVVRVRARAEAIKSAESALEATQTGYEVGTRNIVEVLQAQRRLFQSQFDYATSRYDYVNNLLRLKETAGALDASDIAELNNYMDGDRPVRPYSSR